MRNYLQLIIIFSLIVNHEFNQRNIHEYQGHHTSEYGKLSQFLEKCVITYRQSYHCHQWLLAP